jgi:hypothetical protein
MVRWCLLVLLLVATFAGCSSNTVEIPKETEKMKGSARGMGTTFPNPNK